MTLSKKRSPLKEARQPDKRRKQIQAVARYSGLGLEMTAAVVFCALLGQWLDNRMGNPTPYFTLAGCFIGVAYVLFRIIREAKG